MTSLTCGSGSARNIVRTAKQTISAYIASSPSSSSSRGIAVAISSAAHLSRPQAHFTRQVAPFHHCNFHTSARTYRSDDPGGKPNDGSHSTIYDDFYNVLESNDPDQAPALTFASITPEQITLSDGLVVTSGLMLVNGSCFMWDAPRLDAERAMPSGVGWEDWLQGEGKVDEAFKLLQVIEPKPEVLLFGTGSRVLPLPAKIRTYLAELGLQVDVQSSHNAASTFNVLAEEGRKVACALIPANRGALERQTGSDAGRTYEDTQVRALKAPTTGTSAFPSMASTVRRTLFTSARSSARFPSSPSSSANFAPTLKHFLMRSSVLSLYRRLLRTTRPIPNPLARWETIQWYRSEVERERYETDLEKIRDLMAQGGRTIKILEGSVGLTDVDCVVLGRGKGLRGGRAREGGTTSQERAVADSHASLG